MKQWLMLMLVLCMASTNGWSQSHEAQQLLLNVEKLTQFRQILDDMKKGYDILVKGYGVIKDLSEGNFSLHKAFLDALLEVSPAVRKYQKIAGIVDLQLQLVRQYKSAYKRFKASEQFTLNEIDYMSRVYERLLTGSLQNLDDLTMVITANKLRMSDDERLASIDRIYTDTEDKLLFLQSFNDKAGVLALQRAKESNDVDVMQRLYNAR